MKLSEQVAALESQIQEANQRIAELTKENIDLSLSVQFWKGEAEKAQRDSTDLIKLDNIQRRNGNIKAFILPNNFMGANTGKDGWGMLTVAVDNATVADFFSDSVIGVLYVVSREEWAKEGVDD